MTNGRLAAVAAATVFLAALTTGPAAAKDKVTYAYLLDPALEGVLYGIRSGKVKSDKIEIEAKALAIPALIQSTPAKKFDVIMNAVMAIPLARRRGLELVVLSSALRAAPGGLGAGVWVKKDSPYKALADLKGKTIGNYALQSTGTTWIRIALWKKHNVNVAYENGDMKWVQMPAPALLAALDSSRVDAATLIHAQAYKASQSGNYRVLAETNKDIKEVFGVDAVAAVNVTYPEKLKAHPENFREFNRMLHESLLYAVKNADAVGREVAKSGKISSEFFKAWLADYSYFPAAVSEGDIKSMDVVWANAKEMGILKDKDIPQARDVVWEHAIRE